MYVVKLSAAATAAIQQMIPNLDKVSAQELREANADQDNQDVARILADMGDEEYCSIQIANTVWCPRCGVCHAAEPVRYELEEEAESFELDADDVVTVNKAHIEAGPHNGDRYLMDFDTHLCSCPGCGNVFTTQRFA